MLTMYCVLYMYYCVCFGNCYSMKLRQIMYRMFRHQRVSLGSAMSSSMLVEPVVEILVSCLLS